MLSAKRVIVGLGGLLVTAIAIAFGIYLLLKNDQFQLFGEMVSRIETQEKVVALTFDDGPQPDRTEQILEILQEEGVKASFFLVGNALEDHPKQAKLLINSGHEIGNHSYSHQRMIFMSYRSVADEIETTNKIIRDFGYTGPLHFRPPFGKKLLTLPLYLRNNDIKTITWDVEPETWGQIPASVQQRVQRGLDGTSPGSIILMHVMNDGGESMQAVAPIIRGLKSRGYRFLTVSELIDSQN